MAATNDWPITQVVVVTEPSKCLPGFTLVDKTYDRREDADLWRDGYFGRKICRFLCVERCAPSPGRDVLVDVAVINEKDPIPAGFTCVDFTSDTRERAMKKKMLCVRYMSSNLTTTAITELIILSKGVRRPPNNYTLVGELNNMALCYKMEPFKTSQPQQPTTPSYQTSPVHTFPTSNAMNMAHVGSALPYAVHPVVNNKQRSSGGHTLDRTGSTLDAHNAVSGIPWQINPKYLDVSRMKNITIPQIRYKSMMDIEKEYSYSFTAERSATATLTRRQ